MLHKTAVGNFLSPEIEEKKFDKTVQNGSLNFLSSSIWPVIHYSFPIQYCPLDVEKRKNSSSFCC